MGSRFTQWDAELVVWDAGEVVALDGVSIELAPVQEDRRSHPKSPNAAAEPSALGRKPGDGKVEKLAWRLAEAVLKDDEKRPARGYGSCGRSLMRSAQIKRFMRTN